MQPSKASGPKLDSSDPRLFHQIRAVLLEEWSAADRKEDVVIRIRHRIDARYDDVVQALYAFLERDLDIEWVNAIWSILSRCSNHRFGKMVRLTNPRHSPNVPVRHAAMLVLQKLAVGGTFGFWGERNKQWQRGARRRLAQLRKSGMLSAYGLE